MDDTINRGIMYGSHPPKGVYFTVILDYNHEHPIFEGEMEPNQVMRSTPMRSFLDAMKASDDMRDALIEKFDGSKYNDVDPNEFEGYHCFLLDEAGDPLARFGIETHDNRNETFH